jgi:UDP-glucuronate 4-epimerase
LVATYLVTGACGFIGWKVCELLLEEGHSVIGIDNLNDAYDVRLKQWRLEQIEDHPHFSFHLLDICDRAALRDVFGAGTTKDAPIAAVINLAARAGVRSSVEDPWVYVETNVTGTLNLLDLCREHGVEKFVLASSSSLYGKDNPMPYREDAHTDHPISPYAASKKAAELFCYSYHALHGLDTTVFRFFTVYGPGGRPDMMLFRLVQWIFEGRPVSVYGDGKQSRDFTYVEDIARGVLAGLKPVGYEVISLGSDRPVVLMEVIRLVEELAGKEALLEFGERHPADVPATWADIGKAERILGWRPQTDFREGVGRLIAWYQANRKWTREITTA